MTHCGFKTDIRYRDDNTGQYIPYVCAEPEENIESELCLIHDENYLKDPKNRKATEQNLKRKLSEKLAKAEPLICIGYRLPSFSFAEIHFDKSVDFRGAVFMGLTSFYEAQFTEQVSFTGAHQILLCQSQCFIITIQIYS